MAGFRAVKEGIDSANDFRQPVVPRRLLRRGEMRVGRAGIGDDEDLGLADRVRYAGSQSDMGRVHATADLFVLPTQYEAFCLAILEAAAGSKGVSNGPKLLAAVTPTVNRPGTVVSKLADSRGVRCSSAIASISFRSWKASP